MTCSKLSSILNSMEDRMSKIRRFCKSERKRILEDFTNSNLSIEEYCNEHQISELVIQMAIDEKIENFGEQGLCLKPLRPTDFVEVDFEKVSSTEDDSFTDIVDVENYEEVKDESKSSNNIIQIKIGKKAVLELPLDIKKKKLISILKAVAAI